MAARKHDPDSGQAPATYFAPPERLTAQELGELVRQISNSPVVDTIMEVMGGWVCVITQTRQVVAINDSLLHVLGIDDPGALLGLRVGEILQCVHAQDHSGGCGTGRLCATCGAAIAMVAALETGAPQERECALTFERAGTRQERDFVVHCCPFKLRNVGLLLITMRDNSEEKRRIALERTFLHDLSNILMGLLPTTELLLEGGHAVGPEPLRDIHRAAVLLTREVRIQRLLAQDSLRNYHADLEETSSGRILDELSGLVARHPAATRQTLAIERPAQDGPFVTDTGLLMRVLTNMVVNALEAGRPGDEVRVGAAPTDTHIGFHVWNRAAIPADVAPRVFQRYFSTKTGGGRGLGTHIMKLVGETLLSGTVDFTSSPEAGTTFRIRLRRESAHVD